MRGRGIIDFRHGTTDVTGKAISGRLRGIHLNHAGQTQARQLVSRLDGWAIDRIVASHLKRAVETATPLAEARRLPIYQLDAVTELDFGHWTGRNLDELEQDPEWWNFVHHRAAALIPEGETLYQVQARMVRAMLQLHRAQPHASIALFSHGDPLKTLICHCCCIPLDCMLRFELETASISVVDVGDQHPVVRGRQYARPCGKHYRQGGRVMKRILVTGGAGFLGRHVCKRLLEQGHQVICLDNFYTGHKNNILELMDNPYFEILRHDVCFPIYVEVDEIYNLACPASPIYYQRDPVQTIKTSVHGAINILGLAKRLRARVFQASTSEVYGDPLMHPQVEHYWGHVNPIGARSCYDEGKRCAESLFQAYHQQHGIEIKLARIFNTYGPYMQHSDGRAISNFVVQALRNEPITLYGDGSQTRSFCYVSDLIKACMRFMETDSRVTCPMNLGNPSEFSILQLATLIKEETNSRSKIVFSPLPMDDPKQRRPDISYAMRELDWHPQVSLQEGLRHTIEYFERGLAKLHKPSIFGCPWA